MEATCGNGFANVEVLFREYSDRILAYIRSRINNQEDAENLSQDVWMRILENDGKICMETAKSYIFKIASNLINDYLRTLYARLGAQEEIQRTHSIEYNRTPEQEYSAKQIEKMEHQRIECLPKQRRIIYIMSRFQEKSVAEIADSLSLSFRTVENHLRMGRRDVREFISAIA